MVQPKASSWMKMDVLISSRCVPSFSFRTDPLLDEQIDDEREDGVGDTGAALNACGASLFKGAILRKSG
jgi:hypothetical protein